MKRVMNIYDLLKKFGSHLTCFQFFIDYDGSQAYTLHVYKSGHIDIINMNDQLYPKRMDACIEGNYIKLVTKEKVYTFSIPVKFDVLELDENYTLYIPQNEDNSDIYKMLLRRINIYLDSRLFDKSVWMQFKRLTPC
jgi:hypothetical protein